MMAANSAGVLPITARPWASNVLRTSGSAKILKVAAVQPFDDRRRSSCGRQEGVPRHRRNEAANYSLVHGRNLGGARPAFLRADGECPQLPVPHQRKRRGGAEKRYGDTPAEDIGHRHRYAPIGDVLEIDAGHEFEQLGGEMVSRAGAAQEAKDSFPGFARASATSSCTVFTGTSLLTTRTLGVKQSCEIGAKSRSDRTAVSGTGSD